MADRNSLILSLSWSLLRSIVWSSWRMACLLIGSLLLLFNRLLRSLVFCLIIVICALVSLSGLLVYSWSTSMLIRTSLGTLFLSLTRWVMILIGTVIVLLSLFLMLTRGFTHWSIVMVTLRRRVLFCVHIHNSIFI